MLFIQKPLVRKTDQFMSKPPQLLVLLLVKQMVTIVIFTTVFLMPPKQADVSDVFYSALAIFERPKHIRPYIHTYIRQH